MSPWRLRSGKVRNGRRTLGLARNAIAWSESNDAMETESWEHFQAVWPARISPSLRVLDVVVASDLAVHWLQVPPVDVVSLSELKMVAAARCAHLHGGAVHDWRVAGDWRVGRPFVCAGLPSDAAEMIEQLVRDAHVQVRWHTAVGAATRAGSWPVDGWSALRTPGSVTLWHCNGGWIDCLSAWAVHPQATVAELAVECVSQLKIEVLRDARLQFGVLHWCDAGGAALTDLPNGVVHIDSEPVIAAEEAQAALALYSRFERTR